MAREPERGRCCLNTLISLGLTGLFLWLTLRTQKPKCFIQSLYLPSLNTTSNHHNNNNNNTIVFQLKLVNINKDKGVQYDAVRVSFFIFIDANTTRHVADSTLDGFYQGRGKTAKKWGSAMARRGGFNRTVVINGRLFFRLEFVTEVKYKIIWFYTKRHRLFGAANVEVNVNSGEKVDPKGIRLGDVAPRIGSEAADVRGCCDMILRFFVTLLFLSAFT